MQRVTRQAKAHPCRARLPQLIDDAIAVDFCRVVASRRGDERALPVAALEQPLTGQTLIDAKHRVLVNG